MNEMLGRGLSEAMAGHVSELRFRELPEVVRARVLDIVLDSFASAFAGHDSAEWAAVMRGASMLAPGTEATVIGGGSLSPAGATVVNGYLITGVTVCDIHRPTVCHVTPEVIPPAMAVSEMLGSPGERFLGAVAAGLEVATRVGMALKPPVFRSRGWHAPGVVGPFGGAAAAGHLFSLDTKALRDAFGMAGSQAAGTYAQLGTSTIKLQQSRGALGGLFSAIMANQGLTAAEDVLGHQDGGLLTTYSDGGEPEALTSGLGEEWELMRISLRPWPVAVHLQPVVTGLLELLRNHDVRANQVRSLHVHLSPTAYRMHGQVPWADRFLARLSAPYVSAVVLCDQRCWLEQFSVDRVADKVVNRVAREVVTIESRDTVSDGTAIVELVTSDDSAYRQKVVISHGDPADPLDRSEIVDKFNAAASYVLTDDTREQALDMILNLEQLSDMRLLSDLLRVSGEAQ